MSVLWVGGEDHQFQVGIAPFVTTTSGYYRSGYARCCVTVQSSPSGCRSNPFAAGAQTSAWFSGRFTMVGSSSQVSNANGKWGGLSLSTGPTTFPGLYFGTSSATNNKFALIAWDGTTQTQLATEAGTSIPGGNPLFKIDMQVISWGTSATVNFYFNGTLLITWTGNLPTVTGGMTNFDCVALGPTPISLSGNMGCSELIVSTGDTRSLSLCTLALTGAGTNTAWTNNTYTNINGATFSDTSPAYDNNNGDEQQYTVNGLPTGTLLVQAVEVTARALDASGSSVSHLALGYRTGGASAYGTGATKAPGTAFSCFEQVDNSNPGTGVSWTVSDIASLQLSMKAST